MVCNPGRWTWGLFPLAIVAALATFGVGPAVERDLRVRAANALRNAGYYWALASFNGRDAMLEGISFSGQDRDAALAVLKNVWGVRSVADEVQLIASPDTYTWVASKKDKRIQLRGYVPTEEDRRTVLGFIKAALPEFTVDDKMALAGGAPSRQVWLGSVSFALVQLSQLGAGNVKLDGANLTVEGEASTTEAYRRLRTTFATQAPAGLTVKSVTLLPPVVRPYDWRVKYTGSTISFAGYVPNEEAHRLILNRTKNLFPGIAIEDTMELASGEPDSWSWAISASMTQLNRLESGRIKIKDTVLEFEGVASDDLTAKQVTSSIRNSLPASFRSSEKIDIASKKEQPANKSN